VTNEYLFSSNEHRDKIEKYRPNGVTVEIDDTNNAEFWIAKYVVPDNNEEAAKTLSAVGAFLSDFAPVVLTCESSGYYNQELFPLINELERKLRKLVYLAVFKSVNNDTRELVANLEEKDFGTIFKLLFVDPDFIKGLKSRVNGSKGSEFEGKDSFAKSEIQKYLDMAEENTLWVQILGADIVPTLQERFRDVQLFRNDVMHAHNMDNEHYFDAKTLFIKINKEQDDAIKNLLEIPNDVSGDEKRDATQLMMSAMQKHLASSISEMVKSLPHMNPQYLSSIQKAFKTHFDSPYYQAIMTSSANSALLSLHKTAQEMQKMNLPSLKRIYQLQQLQQQLNAEIEPYKELLEKNESFLSGLSDSDLLNTDTDDEL